MDALLRQALVGTRRSGAIAATGTPADALSQDADPAWRLLQRAGCLALLRRAARPPARVPAPAVDPGGDRPCPSALRPLMASLLAGETPELLPEALRLLAAAGRVLPPELLPRALGSVDHRPLLHPVLGSRGRWLAAQEPSWSWALEAPLPKLEVLRERWETERTEDRIRVLSEVRRQDPARGLAWLREVWPNERAEVRALLLVGLAESLCEADEPFLELLLDERSGRVRERAAALLRRLPNSRLCQRMHARLTRMMSWREPKKGILDRILTRPRLAVSTPEAYTADLRRDGVAEAPEHGLAPEASWLAGMLAAVPPRRWSERFQVSAAAMLAELPSERWEVAEGWSNAVCEVPDGEWILALWAWWRRADVLRSAARARSEHWQDELVRQLPPPEASSFALDLLRSPTLVEAGRLATALERLAPAWPVPVASAWLYELRASVASLDPLSARELLWWELSIVDAAPNLPRACLHDAVFPIPETLSVRRWRNSLESFMAAIRRRQILFRELTP